MWNFICSQFGGLSHWEVLDFVMSDWGTAIILGLVPSERDLLICSFAYDFFQTQDRVGVTRRVKKHPIDLAIL